MGSLPELHFDWPRGLLALLMLPPVLWLARRRLRLAPPGQRRAVLALRAAVFAAVALALARPALGWPVTTRSLVFVVDLSQSLTPAQRAWELGWVRQAVTLLGPESHVAAVQFGAQAEAVPLDQLGVALPAGDATDVEAALRLAGSLLPDRAPSQVVLLSDGWETRGTAATVSLPDGMALSYVLPGPTGAAPEALLQRLELSPTVQDGDALDLVAVAESSEPQAARLRLSLDGSAPQEQAVMLDAGQSRFSLAPRIHGSGFHSIHVELLPERDTILDNNALDAVTVAAEPGRVLLLEERAGEGQTVGALLQAQGLQVQPRSVDSIPPTVAGLSEFDAVVLVDASATNLSLDRQRTLESFVKDLGRGLVVVGGPHSFAPGGYEGSVLDQLLPVASEPPVQRQQGNVALILVIDKSSSMDLFRDNVSKIAMARAAAIQATELLHAEDTLGVVAFDTDFRWVVPPTQLHSAADVQQAQARIEGLQASGGTSILPALQAAYQAASSSNARLKHIVLLTDGQSFDSGHERLIESMRPYQITLSTVAIGSDADTKLLANLARLGEGRYYFTERSAEVPRIASREATILTRNALVQGQIAANLADPSPLLRGLTGQFPPLSGYVATTPKARAVIALTSDRGHPLLAHWQYGLGRVVAWTADAQGPWSSQWADWPEAARLWSQAVRWTMPSARPDFQVSARIEGGNLRLRAESVGDDGHFAELQDTRATVVSPDGTARLVRLPQVAPGAYELTTRVEQPGAYRVVFDQDPAGQPGREALAGAVFDPVPELRHLGANAALLAQLARYSGGGGQLREPADLLATPGATLGERRTELWPWLFALALALLPLDVAVRRLRWPWLGREPAVKVPK